ncbi:MAG: hypothetical protein IJ635_05300 [Bacteroidaceae bacterium]|nr:hypothetical protein [Bacteroidaceae bacterium]
MEKKQNDNTDVNITDLNSHILQFCSRILTQFQDVLDDREKDICKYLLEGRSRTWVCENYSISRERVRQIFYKSIKKISDAYEEVLQKIEEITKENEKLKHKNFVLENELISFQAKKSVDSLLGQEQSLCMNAVKLLNVPVRYLPMSARAINVLEAVNAQTFKEIPLLTPEQLYRINKCGNKTIYDIKNYLSKFDLELGMLYDDVVKKLAKLSNEDISSENFGAYRVKKSPIEIIQEVHTMGQLEQMTLSQFCAEMGHGKKARKKWGGQVKRILLANQIDTLEKFLAMKPSEFEALKGVGPTTVKYARIAFDRFGLVWTDVSCESDKGLEISNHE